MLPAPCPVCTHVCNYCVCIVYLLPNMHGRRTRHGIESVRRVCGPTGRRTGGVQACCQWRRG
jgi:hypothetical protein